MELTAVSAFCRRGVTVVTDGGVRVGRPGAGGLDADDATSTKIPAEKMVVKSLLATNCIWASLIRTRRQNSARLIDSQLFDNVRLNYSTMTIRLFDFDCQNRASVEVPAFVDRW